MSRAGEIAKRLDPRAKRTGKTWRVPCVAHQGDGFNLELFDSKDEQTGNWRLGVKCYSRGCSTSTILDQIVAAGHDVGEWPRNRTTKDRKQKRRKSQDIEDPVPPERPDDYIGPHYNSPRLNYEDAVWAAVNGFDGGDPELLKKIADLHDAWERALSVKGSLADVYARARIPILRPDFDFNHDAVRFEPHCWNPYTQRHHPTLTAKVVRARTAQFCALTRIHLLHDGSNRLPDEQHGRLTFGTATNGVVKLRPQRSEDGELVVIEGVIKGLAAIACGVPGVVAATLGKSGMANFPHLPGVARLSIIADNDEAGSKAAYQLSRRYRWRGTKTRAVFSPWGKDVDAFLRGER
jgi:hypothetical protein